MAPTTGTDLTREAVGCWLEVKYVGLGGTFRSKYFRYNVPVYRALLSSLELQILHPQNVTRRALRTFPDDPPRNDSETLCRLPSALVLMVVSVCIVKGGGGDRHPAVYSFLLTTELRFFLTFQPI